MVKRLHTMRETRVQSMVGKISWKRKWQSTPVLLSGKFHGWRSLVGYSPCGCKESDMTEQLQCQFYIVEENNRLGKTRDQIKKIRYQGNISCKDGHNNRNGMDVTEAEDIKKRWQEYTELYKKFFMTQIIAMVL